MSAWTAAALGATGFLYGWLLPVLAELLTPRKATHAYHPQHA